MTKHVTATIRTATAADIDAIIAFGTAFVPRHYEPIIGREAAQGQVDRWWTRDRFLTVLDDGELFVAEEPGQIVGVAELGAWDDTPVIWKLYVHPDRRGRGIGRSLLRAVITRLPTATSRVLLEHFAGNERAADFYAREGFVHLRTEPAASGDPSAATEWRVLELPHDRPASEGRPSEGADERGSAGSDEDHHGEGRP